MLNPTKILYINLGNLINQYRKQSPSVGQILLPVPLNLGLVKLEQSFWGILKFCAKYTSSGSQSSSYELLFLDQCRLYFPLSHSYIKHANTVKYFC